MKAWLARDKFFRSDAMYLLFFGKDKPSLSKLGFWHQGSNDSNGRWPVDAEPFGPMEPGELRRIEIRMLKKGSK